MKTHAQKSNAKQASAPQPASHGPQHPAANLQRTAGNQAMRRLLEAGVVQAKLRISTPGDPAEQEADRIAEQVTGECSDCDAGHPCPKCKEKGGVQRKAVGNATLPAAAGAVVSNLGPGEALANPARTDLESRFGSDFSGVRIHRDARAAESARQIDARAYTLGNHIVFDSGQYAPQAESGRRLLAHELAHVLQQSSASEPVIYRSTGPAPGTGSPPAGGAPAVGAPAPAGPRRINVDVLSALNPEDFLIRAAAQNLGVDIRVSSMEDLVNQVERQASGTTCVNQLSVFNHGNPQFQAASGGSKIKTAEGARAVTPTSGFSLTWLLENANQGALNRLRHSLCCGSTMNWYGCSTAGVWAEGGQRTAAEVQSSTERYVGVFSSAYHDVADAMAHGATRFSFIGPANVQSWSNALCASVNASTDFNNWTTSHGTATHTVIYGGQQLHFAPEAAAHCACDPATGRASGDAPTSAQLTQRAAELREQALQPFFQQNRGALGATVTPAAETDAERAARVQSEQQRAAFLTQVGNEIRDAVLTSAGFTGGAQPANADEALRVTTLWGLDLDHIKTGLSHLNLSMTERTTGTHTEDDLGAQQQTLLDALTPRGRETFQSALAAVRQEHYWNQYLATHTIYMFPDLSGVNRYRGYTQTATRTDPSGRTSTVSVIHLSKDLLNGGQTELATASMVHELSHTLDTTTVKGAMESFETALAGLLVDHPDIVAMRHDAPDPTAARNTQIMHLRQMLYEATGYSEGEIFVHLQQLSHQPNMTIGGTAVSGSRFILEEVTSWIRQLRRIGIPAARLNTILRETIRRAMATYDARIAAAPAGSNERRLLEEDKRLAGLLVQVAVDDASRP